MPEERQRHICFVDQIETSCHNHHENIKVLNLGSAQWRQTKTDENSEKEEESHHPDDICVHTL